jgi:hypothetical protein
MRFGNDRLSRFPVEALNATSGTELLQLEPACIVAPVLLGCVVPFPALGAFHGNDEAVSLALLRHYILPAFWLRVAIRGHSRLNMPFEIAGHALESGPVKL